MSLVREFGREDLAQQMPSQLLSICRRCNSEMGEKFDDPTAPILKPMMDGYEVTLTPQAQVRVATWLLKYVLLGTLQIIVNPKTGTLQQDEPLRKYLADRLRHMLMTRTPPPGTFVRIAAVNMSDATPLSVDSIRAYEPANDAPEGVISGAGRFGVFMYDGFIGSEDEVFDLINRAVDDKGRLIRIWPPQVEDVLWPPRPLFSESEYWSLVQAWPQDRQSRRYPGLCYPPHKGPCPGGTCRTDPSDLRRR